MTQTNKIGIVCGQNISAINNLSCYLQNFRQRVTVFNQEMLILGETSYRKLQFAVADPQTKVCATNWQLGINSMLTAFEKGAKRVNPDVVVRRVYVGNWSDIGKGKVLALAHINEASDFLFPVADAKAKIIAGELKVSQTYLTETHE